MLPAWAIRLAGKKLLDIANDKADDLAEVKKKVDDSGAGRERPEGDSPMPEEAPEEQAGQAAPDDAGATATIGTRRRRRKALTPVRGAGLGSFLLLGEASMDFWADALTSVYDYKPKNAGDEPEEEEVSSQPEEPAPEEDDEEDGNHWVRNILLTLGSLALAYFIAKYGLKLIKRDGKTIIMATKWEELLADYADARTDYSDAEYADGNIIERSGLGAGHITSKYAEVRDNGAYIHRAIDITVPEGTPIEAPFDGYINYVDNVDDSKAGKYVEIATPDGLHVFRYLHLSEPLVRAGQQVKQGEIIAKSGNTYGGVRRANGLPWSSGAHVHLEYRRPDAKIAVGKSAYGAALENPLKFGAVLPATADFVGGSDVAVTFSNPTTIGIEGKNLMSVRDDGQSEWLGTVGTNTNRAGNFVAFDTYAHGLRAGMINVQKYQTKHDVSNSGGEYTTIRDIAQNDKKHSYVDPRNGDRIPDWINHVSEGSGFAPDEHIDLRRTEHLARITQGITRAEHSATPNRDDVELVIRTYKITNDLVSNTQQK